MASSEKRTSIEIVAIILHPEFASYKNLDQKSPEWASTSGGGVESYPPVAFLYPNVVVFRLSLSAMISQVPSLGDSVSHRPIDYAGSGSRPTGPSATEDAIGYAKASAKFGRGEIRLTDHNGSIERMISFDQTDAKL